MFLFAVTTLLGFFYDHQNKGGVVNLQRKPNSRWALILVFLIYGVFVGCRGYGVGSDTPAYVFYLQDASSRQLGEYLASNNYVEPIFHLLVWACMALVDSPSFFFIINAAFYFAVFVWFIQKYSKSLGWSLWLINSIGFATMALSTIRQSTAIAFCLLAYMYLDKSKIKPWLFFILAVGTHISSSIFLPMMFVNHLRKRNVPFYLVLLIIAAFTMGPILISRMALEYESVTGKYDQELITTSVVGGIGMVVFLAVILFMGMETYLPIKKGLLQKYSNELFAVGMALVVFIVARVNVAVIRLYWYYLAFIVIYIPNVFSNMGKTNRIVWQLLLIVITSYYLVTQVMSSPYEVSKLLLPYRFFWDVSGTVY